MVKREILMASILSRFAAVSVGASSSYPWLWSRNETSPLGNGTSGVLACDALINAGLGNRLLLPTDTGYEPQIETWYALNARLRPNCLVLPQNSQEVSTALTALVNANDGAGDWHIAIRSGGHHMTGTNNIINGVTIDLSHMNSSTYDEQANLAKIEPGGRWWRVYADLEKYGVTVTGGRDGDVGVGGFLLGGGNSYFSGRMGFGCDSVINYEVVLANGSIINVNATANADLWTALKGGSSNFGIVTRFDMEAIPSRDLYYDLRFFGSNYTDNVVDAVVGFTDQDQSLADNALVVFFNHNSTISSDMYSFAIYVNTQGDANAVTAYDSIRDLPVLFNRTKVTNMAEAAAGSMLPSGLRIASSSLTLKNDPQILRRAVGLFQELVGKLKLSIGADKFVANMVYQPIPTYMAGVSQQRGGNMLGLDDVEENAIMWSMSLWVDADEAALALAQAETLAFTARVKEMSRAMGDNIDFIYINYADVSQDVLGTYGAANVQHMREVAAAYDPTGVFQKRVPGGFKISRCDNCKSRKTKCDRRSPCASCVTLGVACRSTQKVSEKRQRVLLSTKYEDAVQDVSRQLGEVKNMLQSLMLRNDDAHPSAGTSTSSARRSPRPMIDEQVPSLSAVHDGFRGDSSFQSHASIATLSASEFLSAQGLASPSTPTPPGVTDLLRIPAHPDPVPPKTRTVPELPSQSFDVDLGDLPLPPIDTVLKLLRMAKATKQSFFIDHAWLTEDEFTDKCRDVFFATEPISIWTWISVNIGLYWLFQGANEADCRSLGQTAATIRQHHEILTANIEAAMQSLRLCAEPTVETCHALALLVSVVMSGAARACLDLGFHRLPHDSDEPDVSRDRRVFWYIFAWDKLLAMASGTTPVIHAYDVSTGYPFSEEERRNTIGGHVYGAWLDYSCVTGEIQHRLFSASALREAQEVRNQHAMRLAARIREIQESMDTALREDPTLVPSFTVVITVLDFLCYSLLTIVYRTLRPPLSRAHPLQCSDECVGAARMALSRLVNALEKLISTDPVRRGYFLNTVLTLVPFVSFIVLAGNAIATSSSADLALLSSVISILESPQVGEYPTIRKIRDACGSFGRITSIIVSSANEQGSRDPAAAYQQIPSNSLHLDASTNGSHSAADYTDPMGHGFPMGHQDWDNVMLGFESELGDYDFRNLTNTIEPYFANTSW
ncbi:hypothetical protein F4778DRAFT_771795 [Xylariomycetidae sp. FL2044]|nr:hypothetical protein F4778DRAFT_771795 [Xylariomycetidae sp. FL2044]